MGIMLLIRQAVYLILFLFVVQLDANIYFLGAVAIERFVEVLVATFVYGADHIVLRCLATLGLEI